MLLRVRIMVRPTPELKRELLLLIFATQVRRIPIVWSAKPMQLQPLRLVTRLPAMDVPSGVPLETVQPRAPHAPPLLDPVPTLELPVTNWSVPTLQIPKSLRMLPLMEAPAVTNA